MIKSKTTSHTLPKAKVLKTALASAAMASILISPSVFARLSCDIGSSKFYSKSIIIKDVEVSNAGQSVANNVRIALTFDKAVTFDRAWGDVSGAPSVNGKTVTFNAKSGSITPGNSIDFGFKSGNTNKASSVTCQVLRGTNTPVAQTPATPSRPSRPAATPSRPSRPTSTPTPTRNPTSVTSSEKCPTSNSGALMVQNFEYFDLGKPGINERKAFQKQFCSPLHTIAGFGALDETVKTKPKEIIQARGRAAAGQREHAQDFVRLEIINDDNAFEGKSLKVLYPNGGNTSSHSGVQYPEHIPSTIKYDRDTQSFTGQNSFQEMYVSYWVKFEDDFTWQLGGKLPGMIADRGFNDPDREDRVNTRLMWRENGKLEFYIHTPYLKKKTAGRAYEDRIFWDNGNDIDGHAKLTKGKWHHIEFRMKLNDVINGVVYPNGEIEGWLDGKHAAFYNDVTLRGNPDYNINTFFFSTFFGGSSGNGEQVWWPTKDVYAYFDQIEVSDKRIGCCNRSSN